MYHLRVIHQDGTQQNCYLGKKYTYLNISSVDCSQESNYFDMLVSEEAKGASVLIVGEDNTCIPLYYGDVAYIVLDNGNTYTKVVIPICNSIPPEECNSANKFFERAEK